MAQPKKVSEEWETISQFLKEQISEADWFLLGGTLKEYVEESIHGGWDGFESSDLTGVRKFLLDLIIYHNNR